VNYRQTLHAADDGKVAAVPTSQNDERRAWIAQARHFVSITVRKYPDQAYFRDQLKSDQIFYRLRPYLSDHFMMPLRQNCLPGGLDEYLRRLDESDVASLFRDSSTVYPLLLSPDGDERYPCYGGGGCRCACTASLFPNPGASAGYLTIPLHPVIRPFSRRHVPQSPESRHKLRL
jgi:hypothetical protein